MRLGADHGRGRRRNLADKRLPFHWAILLLTLACRVGWRRVGVPFPYRSPLPIYHDVKSASSKRRRAVAMSGTGNGDSFLRVNAARTAAALCRFSQSTSLADAVTAVAGPNGELQLSAGDRWGHTGEGQGGIIGIELVDDDVHWAPRGGEMQLGRKVGHAVFDFNCGGLFRAYYEIDRDAGEERPKVMVFKDEY